MKFTFRNTYDSETKVIELDTLVSAKTRCSQFYRDYPTITIIMIFNAQKLICSKKLGDRFWTTGLRSKRNYNTHKHTPITPMLQKIKLLEYKRSEYLTKIAQIENHIELTKSEIEISKKNRENFLNIQKSILKK